MKYNKIISLIVIFAIGFTFQLIAQNKPNISGNLSTDNRLLMASENPWAWNENRLEIKLDHKLEGKAKFFSNIWVRNFGLYEAEKFIKTPEVREAYVEVYDFLLKGLDIKAGRQRIKWGCADKINPTDNVNPYDMEDLWDFGRHLGSEAIQLKYYKNDFKAELVYLPNFRNNRLPLGDMSDILMPEFNFPDSMAMDISGIPINFGLTNTGYTISERFPKYNMAEMHSFGGRFSYTLFDFDIAASYMNTLDGFPLPDTAYVNPESINILNASLNYNAEIKTFYPRYHIIGLEASGSIGNVGVWGEAAMFLPEKDHYMKVTLPDINQFITDQIGFNLNVPQPTWPDSLVLSNDPWVHYVIGTDYTFKDGTYCNLQYVHGLVHERGKDNSNEYILLRAEKKLLNDNLRLALINGGVSFNYNLDLADYHAFMYMPEIGYKPNDNTELIIGTRIIVGEGDGVFAKLNDSDEVYLKLTYSF